MALLAAAGMGCATREAALQRSRHDTFRAEPIGRTGAAVGRGRIEADLLFVESLSEELATVLAEAGGLSRMAGQRAELDDDDRDRFLYVLFRFQMCRSGLWDIAEDYHRSRGLFRSESDRILAQLIGYRVMMQLAHADAQFALTFHDQAAARDVLNAAYPLAGIAAGSYDAILATATDPANLEARDAAWYHFRSARESDRALARAAARDARVREAVAAVERSHVFAEESSRRLIELRGRVFPSLENRLRHSLAAGMLQAAAEGGSRGLSALGDLTLHLTRPLIRSPFARGTAFSDEQIDLMLTLIEPGDMLMVHTAGYLTGLFLPGTFKHALVYVGTPDQRAVMGLRQPAGAGRHRADLIEALAPGVVWNRFRSITDRELKRIAVLRPKVSAAERRAYLQTVVDYLGRPYDLRFDFSCPLRLCCTEVIYHALNGRGGIAFPMVRRVGIPTLAPDDMLTHYLNDPGRHFDLVLLGEPDPRDGRQAVVLWGDEATQRLRALLY